MDGGVGGSSKKNKRSSSAGRAPKRSSSTLSLSESESSDIPMKRTKSLSSVTSSDSLKSSKKDGFAKPKTPSTPRSRTSTKQNDASMFAASADTIRSVQQFSKNLFRGRLEIQGNARDYRHLKLRPDADRRPFWVCGDGKIFLESFSEFARHATDFLIAVAEPVCRPDCIHEYILSPYSLFAAVSVGLSASDIIRVLNTFSKNEVPEEVLEHIHKCTHSVGKVKLVLWKTRMFVESNDKTVLRQLRTQPKIAEAIHSIVTKHEQKQSQLIDEEYARAAGLTTAERNALLHRQRQQREAFHGASTTPWISVQDELEKDEDGFVTFGGSSSRSSTEAGVFSTTGDLDFRKQLSDATAKLETNETKSNIQEDEPVEIRYAFEIDPSHSEQVKKACIDLNYPLVEEYDFRRDDDPNNPNLEIDLQSRTKIRPYQEKSLSKMFGNGRARSGLIVLPCGAGKTLVGVTAAQTIKKRTLVLCTSNVSCHQWKEQFCLWTNISPNDIFIFTADTNEVLPCLTDRGRERAAIVISTFHCIGMSGNRKRIAKENLERLRSIPWGLLLLDEVHVLPANMFRKVINIPSHCKLGLTATLVREDDKIGELNFLIGPKLYEANWQELQRDGYLASVQCSEVWCPMSSEFFQEYLSKASTMDYKRLLYVMNPNKVRTCKFLIDFHRRRGDKVIVFSDLLFPLHWYAREFRAPYIDGDVSQAERIAIINRFQKPSSSAESYDVLLLSSVGDTSIDLPNANVIIQISSHFGSRRQEAQRLGRILRPKGRVEDGEHNAFFYTLISRDTQEMFYSSKREMFLLNQGYSFQIITSLGEDLDAHATPSASFTSIYGEYDLSRLPLSSREARVQLIVNLRRESSRGTVAREIASNDELGPNVNDTGEGLEDDSNPRSLLESYEGYRQAQASASLDLRDPYGNIDDSDVERSSLSSSSSANLLRSSSMPRSESSSNLFMSAARRTTTSLSSLSGGSQLK